MITNITGDSSLPNAPLPEKRTEPLKSEAELQKTQKALAAAAAPAYGFQLRVDQQTREVTALIIDPDTKAVIKEIPAKEMKIASDVIRNLVGPLIDKTV